MSKIKDVFARQILDSRGNPTIEVDIITKNGGLGRASVPSGISKGKYEAVEIRDGEKAYSGNGVLKAVKHVNEIIAPEIKGLSVMDQSLIDKLMIDIDGTENKSRLGANAILGVSLAVAKAASADIGIPLYRYIGGINAHIMPVPMMNIVNGGLHSDAPISFQEFMIVPVSANSFSEAIRMGVEIFHQLKELLRRRNLSISVGDEGGFSSKFDSTEEALDAILESIEKSGYKPVEEIMLALDCASSEFYLDGKYDYTRFEGEKGCLRSSEEQVNYLIKLIEKYPIISIEDGMDQNDWEGWKLLSEKIGKNVQLVGDDLFVTNISRLKEGIEKTVANSILIKVNQIGTLSETMTVLNYASRHNYTTIMSHRSGETEDYTISDLSVAFNVSQIKTGSASRSDRMAKYNQLIRIEEMLGSSAFFPKWDAFK